MNHVRGKIIASCGHQVEEVEDLVNVHLKDWTIGEQGWYRTVIYASYCGPCAARADTLKMRLRDEEEILAWLSGEMDEEGFISVLELAAL